MIILDTLEGIEGEIEDKADGYAKNYKKNSEAKKNARKEEAKSIQQKSAKVFENRVTFLKQNH